MLILNSPVYPDLYLVIFSIMVVIILAILNAGNVFLLLKGVDIVPSPVRYAAQYVLP